MNNRNDNKDIKVVCSVGVSFAHNITNDVHKIYNKESRHLKINQIYY